MPIADKQTADGGRDQADQQGNQHGDRDGNALPGSVDTIKRIGQQRRAHDQEDDA